MMMHHNLKYPGKFVLNLSKQAGDKGRIRRQLQIACP